MATLRRPKNSCATCGLNAGAFTCRGCSRSFCIRHTNEHRQALEKTMDDIIHHHNRLKENLVSPATKQHQLSLLEQIDAWEKQSVERIHQAANEVREELSAVVRDHRDAVQDKLTQLSEQLSQAKHDGDYFEHDLTEWTEKLQKLQQKFLGQEQVQIYQVESVTPFITRISLSEKSSERKIYSVINASSRSTSHRGTSTHPTNLTMRGDFSSGDHLFRFKLDDFDANCSVLVGIISAGTADYERPYENPTFYGWSNDNRVYVHGVLSTSHKGYRSDIDKKDTFQLTLDCQRATISLTNERTRSKHELRVDPGKCPFPWKPHVRVLHSSALI